MWPVPLDDQLNEFIDLPDFPTEKIHNGKIIRLPYGRVKEAIKSEA
jgi:hypothetical protein